MRVAVQVSPGSAVITVDPQRTDTADAQVVDLGHHRQRREVREMAERVGDVSVLATVDTVRLYLHEIGRVSLLRADEEVDLAKRMWAGRLAHDVLVNRGDAVEAATARCLRRVQRDGERAMARMIESNLRLVVSLAKRHLGRGLSMPDLIQEGNLGLIRAVERYDPTKGYRFSTYATWWIRQTLGRAVADQARTIRVPAHHHDTMRKLRRAELDLEQTLGRPATDGELAVSLEVEASFVTQLRRWMTSTASLDAGMGSDGDVTLADLLEDEDALAPELAATLSELQRDLERMFTEHLDERERLILTGRFGLGGQQPQTLDQLGDVLGLTRERIRQLESRALARMRHPAFACVLETYLRD